MPTSVDWDAAGFVLLVVALFIFVYVVPSGFMRKLWRTWKGKRD